MNSRHDLDWFGPFEDDPMSSMALLIVYFMATNSDTLDRVQTTVFIICRTVL
jgi:hypothetical protein